MNWNKGIQEAQRLLSILNSGLTAEKKVRKVFIESDSITSDDATAIRRDDIHKWREKFLNSDLPNLKEHESANFELAKVQTILLEEIKSICDEIIEENTTNKESEV
jgi:hypothetical protein